MIIILAIASIVLAIVAFLQWLCGRAKVKPVKASQSDDIRHMLAEHIDERGYPRD